MLSPALRYARANNGLTFRPDANTVLWLPGQDDPQSALIRDRSGNKNDGTIDGATWAKTGRGLSYLDYDGADDLTTVAESASITDFFDSGGSMWWWMKPDSDGEGNTGRICNPSTWVIRVKLETGDGVLIELLHTFTGDDGNWVSHATTGRFPIGAWNMGSATYNSDATANKALLYKNGVLLTYSAESQPTGTRDSSAGADFFIGNNVGGTATFDGGIALMGASKIILPASFFANTYQQQRHLFGR